MKNTRITYTIIYAFVTGVVILVTILLTDKFKDNIPGGLWGRCLVIGVVFALLVALRSLVLRCFCSKDNIKGSTGSQHAESP